MPCFFPLKAYYSREFGKSGKRGITFDRNASFSGLSMALPCGQCVGCRLEHSRQWAMRCMHEKSMHTDSEFVTLTYDPECMPPDGSLVKRDLQLFMKRLRKKVGKVRFYACGEYGDRHGRPHYHLILFGIRFTDRQFYKTAKNGDKLYTSRFLEGIWKYGFNVIGDVTFESCAYVARYICDKITGDLAEAHYQGRQPEFTNMSRRPGIGVEWFRKFGEHSYAHDSVVLRGKEMRPPRFYDTMFEVVDGPRMAVLKRKRRREALRHKADDTPDRRRVKEAVTKASLRIFKRDT